ncbi:TonB-dependent hemoglobin/transferrin/lactoferrin family receptor [Acinetobacter sp. c2-A9]|uniref:TonB-dependent hemoglobin/transferrin/lactoferrin family receptor n=1 Tax=Acinetobacter sp. c2-A9 TaxID=3342802 RepID=UPI0035BAAF46
MHNLDKKSAFFYKSSLTVAILVAVQLSYANTSTTTPPPNATSNNSETVHDLGTIQIVADAKQEKLAETVKTAQELSKELVNNSQDLVRYNNEVDVAEVGRYGNKGFAIRGVDGNRVAMNIDGIALPEAEANEIYAPYGYMYEGRFNPDVEMMRSVRITAGADSLTSGSGAVGGAVSYDTKMPHDLLQDGKNLGGYVKTGYANKNEELLSAVGLAGVWNQAEFLVNYAQRNGSETRNHNMRPSDRVRISPNYIFNEEEMPAANSSRSLIYPNPLDYKRESALAKFYYNLNDSHRIGLQGYWQQQRNDMNTDSANATSGSRLGGTTRRAHDKEQMQSYGLSYRYQPDAVPFLESVNIDYNRSKVQGIADTWIYDREFACSDPKVSSWRCTDAGHQMVLAKDGVTLSNREYRPTQTNADQFSLKLALQPIDLNRFGEHKLAFNTDFVRQDYQISGIYLGYKTIADHLSATFPDAKKKHYHFTVTDNVQINDGLKATLGLRYDNYHYQPYLQNNTYGFSEIDLTQRICKNEFNSTLYCANYRAGKSMPKSRFNHFTYAGSLDWAAIPDRLNVRYKAGTGFLAPTVTQIYSQFEGLGARQVPNYNLKPEKSFNQELELQYKPTDDLTLTVGGYYTKYRDFIHTRYWRGATNHCTNRLTCMQSMNLDDAQVKGLKLGLDSNVSRLFKLNGDLSLSVNYHTAQDKAIIDSDSSGKKTINTLAAVPNSLMFSADYLSPDQSWELHGKMRVLYRKKAKDTKTLESREINQVKETECPADIAAYDGCEYMGYEYNDTTGKYTRTQNTVVGYEDYVDTYQHIDRSKTAVLFDIYGTKRFGAQQNLSLNAGVYNIFNQKYIPWESLRQFNNINANTMVDIGRGGTGHGFNRYTAPGRNYAISLEYKF